MIAHAILHCRAGFEPDCAKEITQVAASLGVSGRAQFEPGGALVVFTPSLSNDTTSLYRNLRVADLVFARQVLFAADRLSGLPRGDRIAPLAGAAAALGRVFSTLWIETADSDDAKPLATLNRRLAAPLQRALADAGIATGKSDAPHLHVLVDSTASAWVGISSPRRASPLPMGIPRLRFPYGAPSRSALKLIEAIETLLTAEERAMLLKPGARAVDLGAAPGGWSWVLASRGLRVTAVDNGPMAKPVMDTGMVEHRREDGFRYRPPRGVSLMVCDMVERPQRVADLAAAWIADGVTKAAIFNLKLPMKKRLEAVEECRGLIRKRLPGKFVVRIRQLYHDREEVTAFLLASHKPA